MLCEAMIPSCFKRATINGILSLGQLGNIPESCHGPLSLAGGTLLEAILACLPEATEEHNCWLSVDAVFHSRVMVVYQWLTQTEPWRHCHRSESQSKQITGLMLFHYQCMDRVGLRSIMCSRLLGHWIFLQKLKCYESQILLYLHKIFIYQARQFHNFEMYYPAGLIFSYANHITSKHFHSLLGMNVAKSFLVIL